MLCWIPRTDLSRILLDQAFHIYAGRAYYRPELARTYYLLSKADAVNGGLTDSTGHLTRALSLYQQLRPEEPVPTPQDQETAFDKLVCFASR